jgi:hypothetical protein
MNVDVVLTKDIKRTDVTYRKAPGKVVKYVGCISSISLHPHQDLFY